MDHSYHDDDDNELTSNVVVENNYKPNTNDTLTKDQIMNIFCYNHQQNVEFMDETEVEELS